MTTSIPELWVDRGAQAVAVYQAAFGVTVLHQVGEGEDIDAPEASQRAMTSATFRSG